MSLQRPLLIVDGDNLAHRAYHSSPKSIVGSDGKPINAITGFLSMLQKLWTAEEPRAVYVAWDTLGVDTYRSELLPEYQGGRVFEPDIVRQLEMLPAICQAFGFGVGKQAGLEADDLMASAAAAELRQGGTCLLYTTDRDSYQLVSDRVTVLSPKRGAKEPERVTPNDVVAFFGVLPEQVPDFKALCGDASDKIPGIRGIGPKAAASLLLKHGNLERVVEAWGRSEADAAKALMYRDIATMRPVAEVALPSSSPDWQSGADLIESLGAAGLAERLRKLAV